MAEDEKDERDESPDAVPEELHSGLSFAFLVVLSGGLYLAWWQYLLWRFLRDRCGMPVRPAVRAAVNAFFPVYAFSMFVYPMAFSAKRGRAPDFSAPLFAGAYVLFFFLPLLGGEHVAVLSLLSLLRLVPCLPLLEIHRFLAVSAGVPTREVRFASRSDLVVVLVSLVLTAAVWLLASASALPAGIGAAG